MLQQCPTASDVKLFRSLCGLGAELVALHLLESPKLEKPIARYPVTGSNLVEKGFPKYFAPAEPEPVLVEAASRRHTGGGVNPPLQSILPRLKAGRVYINFGVGEGLALPREREALPYQTPLGRKTFSITFTRSSTPLPTGPATRNSSNPISPACRSLLT